MSFQDVVNKYKKDKKGEVLNKEIYTWNEEGQEFVGKLLSVDPFSGGKYDSKCMQYVFETDSGRVSLILGSAMDKDLDGKVRPGCILFITYKGKKLLDDGRQVNMFSVVDVTNAAK